MKMNLGFRYVFFAVTLLACFTQPLYATKIIDFEIDFKFPDQGVMASSGGSVTLQIPYLPEYQSGEMTYSIEALPYVVETSKAEDLIISGNLSFGSGSGGLSEILVVSALADGEYDVDIHLTFETIHGRVLFRAKGFSVISENGKLWFGVNSIDSAIRAKLLGKSSRINDLSTQTMPNMERLFQEEMKKRMQKLRENQKKNKTYKNVTLAKISKGDALSFEAKWIGPNAAGVDTEFPVNGAKIKIQDKSTHDHDANPATPKVPLTADIEGYIVNGKFIFTAPRKDYTYTIIVESKFPGIKADGSVNTAGGGIGSFDVIANTVTGSVYKVTPPDNSTTYVFSKANLSSSTEQSSVWAAFHGMAEMVLQAKNELKINKDKSFSVIFAPPSGTSFYSSSSKSITILLKDRYDWDVVAHEFGHAIADELNVINSFVGGLHDGSNQYDLNDPQVDNTFQNKKRSLNIALNEGFGTWFGAALLERSSFKGRFKNVGDKTYDDTEDSTFSYNLESNTESTSFGEDTELGIQSLLWDIYDSVGDSNGRATCAGCKDNTNLGLKGVWDVINGSNMENISDFWNLLLDKNFKGKMSDFLKTGDKAIAGKEAALKKALDAGNTFAEFGISPHLFAPVANTQIKLIEKKGPKFEWTQKKTGTLALNKFTLLLYSSDRKTLVYKKELPSGVTSYELDENDLKSIKSEVDALTEAPNALIAVIMGEDDSIAPDTGPYFGTSIDLLLQPFNRAVVLSVDSSGSNRSTDPSNLRITAAKQTINNLRSKAEGITQKKAPDLAGVVDFDSNAVILSSLDDPDVVVSSVNGIDSSGGTNIAAGINSAVSILTDTSAPGLGNLVKDRASIIIFTDGENNAGPIPVISAIENARLKGIRVHMGFLSPFSSPFVINYEAGGDAPVAQTTLLDSISLAVSGAPSTIEEAILQSGGVYAVIGDADSQIAFVTQLENKGLTNTDNSDTGGQTVAGKTTTTDSLDDPTLNKSFIFKGQKNETARLVVNTRGNFIPVLTVYNDQGRIVIVSRDNDRDGVIDIQLPLPYKGQYVAEVFSQEGGTGIFTFFAGVQNIVNSLPVAVDDIVTTFKDKAVTTIDVTLNDTDVDGDNLTVIQADTASIKGGVIVYNNDNTFTYTPPNNFIGEDSFNYTISDGNGGTATAKITITVKAPADTDGDGMLDSWEDDNGLDKNDPSDALLDADGDGLNNLEEFQNNTSPNNIDTDGDGANDGDEVTAGTDPLDANSFPPPQAIPTLQEWALILLSFLLLMLSRSYSSKRRQS